MQSMKAKNSVVSEAYSRFKNYIFYVFDIMLYLLLLYAQILNDTFSVLKKRCTVRCIKCSSIFAIHVRGLRAGHIHQI